MLGTNHQFETLMLSLNMRIANLEGAVLSGTAGASPAMLEDLWARRRALRLLFINRRIEAGKRIVDFHRWRDGDGALLDCAYPEERSRKIAN